MTAPLGTAFTPWGTMYNIPWGTITIRADLRLFRNFGSLWIHSDFGWHLVRNCAIKLYANCISSTDINCSYTTKIKNILFFWMTIFNVSSEKIMKKKKQWINKRNQRKIASPKIYEYSKFDLKRTIFGNAIFRLFEVLISFLLRWWLPRKCYTWFHMEGMRFSVKLSFL